MKTTLAQVFSDLPQGTFDKELLKAESPPIAGELAEVGPQSCFFCFLCTACCLLTTVVC